VAELSVTDRGRGGFGHSGRGSRSAHSDGRPDRSSS